MLPTVEWYQSSKEDLKVPQEYYDALKTLLENSERVKIKIMPMYAERTRNQNSLFHAKVNEIAKWTGQDRDTIKEELKILATAHGYPCECDEYDEPLIDKHGRPVPKPTRDVSVEEFEILIETMYEFCHANGIYLDN